MPMEFRKEGVLMNRSRLATYLVFVFATAIFYVILNALAGGGPVPSTPLPLPLSVQRAAFTTDVFIGFLLAMSGVIYMVFKYRRR